MTKLISLNLSDRAPEQRLYRRSIGTTTGQLAAVAKHRHEFAASAGHEFLDLPYIHDKTAVNASKLLAVQTIGDAADRLP